MNETKQLALSKEAIRDELTLVLQSPLFAQSDRLSRFLQFAVEHALSGTQDVLKEYVIGVEVYDRRPPYHPSQDSIVRTEARRLEANSRSITKAKARTIRYSSTSARAVTCRYSGPRLLWTAIR